MKFTKYLLLAALFFCFQIAEAQKSKKSNTSVSMFQDSVFAGLKFRSIGPAFMSGRISDIAIHPNDENTWYITAGSGGVWKTVNAGITWEPVFDKQAVYSIGCVSIDPNIKDRVWVGTGENIGGRHVGFGDGIYRSDDGGKNWKNMGLKNSEHISEIIIHPDNSDKIYVASQGPLWSKGGDRGFFKSNDGGKTWKKTLGDDEWTGVTDIDMDPRNPDRIYAATWQRHRNVAAYMGGGPNTGIYRSEDGGETWLALKKGLPNSNMGKMGIAISPQKPDEIYAAIELDRRTGGVFKSFDRGNTWQKQSDAVASATGPHYYQELYASPHQYDKIYLVDVRMQISEDGGKTFKRMNEEFKHSDNHALAFKNSDPDYIMVGCDGGLYESFDGEKSWRFFQNLPLTQYYKLALDDSKPFYNIYGGTQDNNTQGGPSRTDNPHGIQNSDWNVVLFGDGHQPATEPGNPNILYAEWQEGGLNRVDLITGEVTDIQPQPGPGEDFERFNWDAPILVSPHNPKRIFFASQRVWRSDNRGDKWNAISGDLTRNQERIELEIMGRKQSYDNAWDFLAMSNYNSITSLAESPKKEGLLYAGTDDGLIQVSEDAGANWRKIEVSSLPGVPKNAFVNDIKADLFDKNRVYVCLDNHKNGDFKPYLYVSKDLGKTWTSLTNSLPKKTLVWRIVQDHVDKNLFFLATEFGIYFSKNAGKEWVQLKGGLPTISFRDLGIQRRENDLVAASFGRSFYVLDDYSALRNVSEEQLKAEATLFPVKDALWYFPKPDLSFGSGKGSQGHQHYVADNPPFGAIFTYYLNDDFKTQKEERREKEKELNKSNSDISFPGWDKVEAERRELDPKIIFTIKDMNDRLVNRVYSSAKKGFHRCNWNLRYPSFYAIDYDNIDISSKEEGDDEEPSGLMCKPGKYKVEMALLQNGKVRKLSEAQEFEVKPLRDPALKGADHQIVADFWRKYEDTYRDLSAFNLSISNEIKRVNAMLIATKRSRAEIGTIDEKLISLRTEILDLKQRSSGNEEKNLVGEKTKPNVELRLGSISRGISYSSYGPTDTHKAQIEIVINELSELRNQLKTIKAKSDQLAQDLINSGAPYIEGSDLD